MNQKEATEALGVASEKLDKVSTGIEELKAQVATGTVSAELVTAIETVGSKADGLVAQLTPSTP